MNQKIQLSLEIPYKHLEEFGSLEDLHFCIAPYVLSHDKYLIFYREALARREHVILDNGMYEQNDPIQDESLINCAVQLRSKYSAPTIIAPDVFNDPQKSYQRALAFRKRAAKYRLFNIGAVVHGTCLRHKQQHYAALVKQNFNPICITFLEGRLDFLKHTRLEFDLWHHFLGMTTVEEICYIRKYIPLPNHTSLDTVKPIKLARLNKHLDPVYNDEPIRGLGKWDPSANLNEDQIEQARENIYYLKHVLQKGIPIHIPRDADEDKLCGSRSSFQIQAGSENT